MCSGRKYLSHHAVDRPGPNNSTVSGGFPHSDIPGSQGALASPGLIAECHVLHRLLLPRHPPNALIALDPIRKKTGPLARGAGTPQPVQQPSGRKSNMTRAGSAQRTRPVKDGNGAKAPDPSSRSVSSDLERLSCPPRRLARPGISIPARNPRPDPAPPPFGRDHRTSRVLLSRRCQRPRSCIPMIGGWKA
jgi:hypothetical protein